MSYIRCKLKFDFRIRHEKDLFSIGAKSTERWTRDLVSRAFNGKGKIHGYGIDKTRSYRGKIVGNSKKPDDMRIHRKPIKLSREAAIRIAMNTNSISREIAEKYTDSELREVLRLLKLKPGF